MNYDDITLPNGKVKTVERKQTVCETATTEVEKQKNTLSYTTNSLNQYTKLQTLNKNDEVKKKFTYEYDNNGNLSKDDINQYFYDYKNRLVKVIQNEVVKLDENNQIIEIIPEVEIVNYTYDILGRRIEKKTEEKRINYIYAGQNAIKEIITDNATNSILETRENIYSNSLDDILSTIITEYSPHPNPLPEGEGVIATSINQYFYEKNHLGSITKITDITGAIVEQYEYDAFGVAYASINNVEAVTQAQGKKKLNIKKAKGSEASNTGDTDELVIDNIRYKRYNGKGKIGNTRLYTGREYDAELQLYYNRARYYSPDLGRFISRDPIDITDDINLYAYVGNNSVMYVDRIGLSKSNISTDDFIKQHDATELLLQYMMDGQSENAIMLVLRSGDQQSKYNIKYQKKFKELVFTPDEDKESCSVYKGGAGHCLVYIDGAETVELSQLGNFLIGYNFNYAGFTLDEYENGNFYNDIYAAGFFTESVLNRSNYFNYSLDKTIDAFNDEAEDQPWYKAGYDFANSHKEGKIHIISDYIKKAKK